MINKNIQNITVWLLPVVVIGGLFWPPLGYLVFFMMVFFLVLSFFRGRVWCSKICPRGAFLDLVLSKFSLKNRLPLFIAKPAFKWSMAVLFMGYFVLQLITAEKTFYAVGFVFVRMCLLTTVIAVVLGIPLHQRIWCVFCPMGTVQGWLHSLGKGHRGLTK